MSKIWDTKMWDPLEVGWFGMDWPYSIICWEQKRFTIVNIAPGSWTLEVTSIYSLWEKSNCNCNWLHCHV